MGWYIKKKKWRIDFHKEKSHRIVNLRTGHYHPFSAINIGPILVDFKDSNGNTNLNLNKNEFTREQIQRLKEFKQKKVVGG